MTQNTAVQTQKVKLTEADLLTGILEVNAKFAKKRATKRLEPIKLVKKSKPKTPARQDYSSLYPKTRMMNPNVMNTVRGVTKVDQTVNLVCHMHGLSKAELLGAARNKWAVKARRCLIVVLRDGGWSLSKIGHLVNRDHTSVLFNLTAFEQRSTEDERAAVSHVLEFYQSFEKVSEKDFANVLCMNELIAAQIELRMKFLKTNLRGKSLLAALECVLASVLHHLQFSHEEIATARNCSEPQVAMRLEWLAEQCTHQEMQVLSEQISDRLCVLRGSV